MLLTRITRLFPLWALAGSTIAWLLPDSFTGLQPAIVPLLGLVMFGMGITLVPGDFLAVLRRPFPVALGIAMQFLLMPLSDGCCLLPQACRHSWRSV